MNTEKNYKVSSPEYKFMEDVCESQTKLNCPESIVIFRDNDGNIVVSGNLKVFPDERTDLIKSIDNFIKNI